MNDQLVEQLLNEDESEALDFKRDQYPFDTATDEQKSELLKDILAFANSWKRSEAYILIGVDDVKGGRSKPVGVISHLDDAKLQQFVNSKTQRRTTFSYRAFPFEGIQIGVVHIPVQDRPIFLTKNYGKLKKDIVYVRRGSSTDEANPDEIARMGVSKQLSAIEEQQEFERRKEILLVQPYFQGAGGMYNKMNGKFKLRNIGEDIKKVSVEWPGEIKGLSRPVSYLAKGGVIEIVVDNLPDPLPEEGFPIVISYEDKFGNKNNKSLHYDFRIVDWIEDETVLGA